MPPAPKHGPSVADVHQLFADGKYKEVIRGITKITTSREWQASRPDAYELLCLKAEAHLKLKEGTPAATTFDAAARVTTDKAAAAAARTTAILIKRSIGLRYISRPNAAKRVPGQKAEEHVAIDIVDPESRKTALTTFWQEEKDAAGEKISAATDGKSMQAVLDVAPALAHLHELDWAAHGNDDDTKQMSASIAAHGRDLLGEMVDKMTIRADVISSKAFAVEQYKIQIPNGHGYSSQDRWRKHGLENLEEKELKDIVANTEKIQAAAKTLTDNLATDADFFDRVTKESKRIHDKAAATLKTDFNQTYTSRNQVKD